MNDECIDFTQRALIALSIIAAVVWLIIIDSPIAMDIVQAVFVLFWSNVTMGGILWAVFSEVYDGQP
jgi:hypothetical protein